MTASCRSHQRWTTLDRWVRPSTTSRSFIALWRAILWQLKRPPEGDRLPTTGIQPRVWECPDSTFLTSWTPTFVEPSRVRSRDCERSDASSMRSAFRTPTRSPLPIVTRSCMRRSNSTDRHWKPTPMPTRPTSTSGCCQGKRSRTRTTDGLNRTGGGLAGGGRHRSARRQRPRAADTGVSPGASWLGTRRPGRVNE